MKRKLIGNGMPNAKRISAVEVSMKVYGLLLLLVTFLYLMVACSGTANENRGAAVNKPATPVPDSNTFGNFTNANIQDPGNVNSQPTAPGSNSSSPRTTPTPSQRPSGNGVNRSSAQPTPTVPASTNTGPFVDSSPADETSPSNRFEASSASSAMATNANVSRPSNSGSVMFSNANRGSNSRPGFPVRPVNVNRTFERVLPVNRRPQ